MIERGRTAAATASGRLEKTRKIPMRDGFDSEVRFHRPKLSPENGSPLFVLIFGVGFVVGNCLQMGPTARALSDLYSATVVCISYRVAPEHPWPQAHYDGWDNLVWIATNAYSLGASTAAGFIIGGTSAGGNIAAIVTQRSLRDKLAALLTGLWMSDSVLFASPENCPMKYKLLHISHEQNEDVPCLFAGQETKYLRSVYNADDFSVNFSPVNAETPHVGMPNTFLQAAGMDVQRDDIIIYWWMLREHGVQARLKVYPGMPHGHADLYPELKASQQAKVDTLQGLGWLLGRKVELEKITETILAVDEPYLPRNHWGMEGGQGETGKS